MKFKYSSEVFWLIWISAVMILIIESCFHKQKAEQGLLLEFSKTKTELASAYDNYLNTKENLQLSEDVYDITLEKYKEGIASSLDLIQIHNQYLTSQSEYITAMSNLLHVKNNLDKLLDNY